MTQLPTAPSTPKLPVLAACLALAFPLAACGVDRTVTGSLVSNDYRETHPIVLAKVPVNLDIFPTRSALDGSSAARVREFAQHYVARGEGQMTILMPAGAPGDAGRKGALAAVRHELLAGGARGYVAVGSYPVADPSLASPIRLSFEELKAKVATACGQWPADLASGSSLETFANRPYYNSGCAFQTIFAAQVDDPRDLANPRAESPPDTEMRSRGITNVRKGQDPGTDWKIRNTSISNVGAQ